MRTRIVLSVMLATALTVTLALPVVAENAMTSVADCQPPQAALSTSLASESPSALPRPIVQGLGQPCGNVFCGAKEYCCNPTCDACLPFGMSCTQEVCDPTSLTETSPPTDSSATTDFFVPAVETAALPCGSNVCQPGQFCCNPSCGICAPFGAACTDVFCPPED